MELIFIVVADQDLCNLGLFPEPLGRPLVLVFTLVVNILLDCLAAKLSFTFLRGRPRLPFPNP